MRIDLHTHSSKSDGTDTPSQLVEKAAAEGLDIVALTDHDATAGWAEAQATAERVGIGLVRGIEISTELQGRSVHLLGYEFDPENGPLVEELTRVRGGRDTRLPVMLERLAELGMELTVEDVARQSRNAAVSGRPHVADALVEKGYVATRTEAFDKYLGSNGPAYVPRYSADLFHAIELIVNAGGRTVVAHPWSRSSKLVLLPEVFADLAAAGLSGIEVDHNDHTTESRERLRKIAVDLDLAWTGSSDYHGTGKIDFELGCNTTDPAQFEKLFDGVRLAWRG